jgi:hypothetical protein
MSTSIQAGATRRVVLRDTRNDRGTQFEAAQIEDDGTLRVTGHHTGPRVSESFGAAITSYDWAYVIAPDRTATLLTLLGGHTSDDVLNLLATYHHQHGGQINDLLRSPRSPPRSATGTDKSLPARDPAPAARNSRGNTARAR